MKAILTVGLVLLFIALTVSSCDDGTVSGLNQANHAGTLTVVTVEELDATEWALMPLDMLSHLYAHGWTRTDRGLERREDVTPFTLRTADGEATVNADGTFRFRGSEEPKLYYQGFEILPDAPLTRKVENGVVQLTVTLSIRDHLTHHEHLPKAGDPSVQYVPCLDYNGPWGNQRDYPHYHPQAAINFNGSDCWSAWPVCMLRDFTPWKYCNGSRNCSGLIGHCSGYHRHTYPGGPSC